MKTETLTREELAQDWWIKMSPTLKQYVVDKLGHTIGLHQGYSDMLTIDEITCLYMLVEVLSSTLENELGKIDEFEIE